MVCVLLGTTISIRQRWMTLTDHAGAAPIVNVRPPRAREPAQPDQGGPVCDLGINTNRTPATIQVRKPVGLRTSSYPRAESGRGSAVGHLASFESLSGACLTVRTLLVLERAAILRTCVDLAAGSCVMVRADLNCVWC